MTTSKKSMLLASVALLASFCGAAAQAPEPLRIGAIVSSTGPGAGAGVPQRNGILLAVKKINEKGRDSRTSY